MMALPGAVLLELAPKSKSAPICAPLVSSHIRSRMSSAWAQWASTSIT
jgi:hypothetical protein